MSIGIKDLIVFKSLKVLKPEIKSDSVKSKYQLTLKNGEVVTNEMIYTYHEKVFDKNDLAHRNLASNMMVQVAMNYGLFCDQLVFEGAFDDFDQRFIRDMIENTSREIYVNKFLQPTEFLLPPYNHMQPEKKDKYTNAEIQFISEDVSDLKKVNSAVPNKEKFAILSSGGKDSLLSYGLLKEKFDPHPVYVNESGRHWFTAYNAFHYMEKVEPNTARVWCNSDRIFNWMARQMPFLRKDFQNVRSDQYPIRLWTVSVFLWGVIPIARKYNMANIIVGNEFDTSLKVNYNGITHYAGLYDQSKYFDNAYTRYYQKKSWGMNQYSILRSLSELLILKILVKRYPELQKQQVSCHASHKDGDRMLPCGKCEKCRRIVGMLKALDENPQRCGYTEDQITYALKALETKKVKQLGMDASQLYYMLTSKGLIQPDEINRKKAKEHKEILRLRFDQERSNTEDLPMWIRAFLWDIYLKYANGVSLLKDHKWQEIESSDPFFEKPYFLNKQNV